MDGKIAPKSHESKQLTLFPKREGRIPGCVKASALECFRGTYRRHAVKGFHANKGDPSGPSGGLKGPTSLQGKDDPMAGRKSDWLIVLGGRESRLQGEAASGE